MLRFFPLLGAILAPLVVVVAATVGDAAAWAAWREARRLQSLLVNTLGLVVIASAVAVPAGTVAALVLARVKVPGAAVLRAAVLAGLFVPLPVTAVAWQIVLGSWLPSLALAPGDIAWRPWSQGVLPAGVVHGFAALPWVIAIVAAGLRTTDRALEDDAVVTGGPWRALRQVLLPRALLAAGAAAAWVAVQTSTEIPVTDAMMVRTTAEEVYTQIVGFSSAGVRAAVALVLPILAVMLVVAYPLARWLVRAVPMNPEPTGRSPTLAFPLAEKAGLSLFVWAVLTVVFLLPMAALLWKAAGGGTTAAPSIAFAMGQIDRALRLHGAVLLQSVLTALVIGIATAGLAATLAWEARTSRSKIALLLAAGLALAFTPGPVIGQGLKETISLLLSIEERFWPGLPFPPLRSLLYDQPSPLPSIIAGMLRFLPVALLMVAPVVRALPRDLLELAALDGASVWREVGRPALARATAIATLAVAGLALGEVSAGKLVAPPGWRMFIFDLFDQMHYGAEPTVAALALVQVGLSVTLVVAGTVLLKFSR